MNPSRVHPFVLRIALGALSFIALVFVGDIFLGGFRAGEGGSPHVAAAVLPITATSTFIYSFNNDGILYEAGSMAESTSPYWWLDSGGKLILAGGVGSTVVGSLPIVDLWRLAYMKTSSTDTDAGAHPQNLLRLVTKAKADNVRVSADYLVLADNWSDSPNRNTSNGLLLMLRYLDYNTLYYAGIRVDGTAVIKKKYQGTYYTLAQKQIFPGEYVQGGRTNLLPHGEWVTLRAETVTNTDGSVTVRLAMRRPEQGGAWTPLLEARDRGQYGGTPPVIAPGHLGIRTDFMDVQFDSFRAEGIPL